jgi:hypothetical protein
MENRAQPSVSREIPHVSAMKEEVVMPGAKINVESSVDQILKEEIAKSATLSKAEDSELILLDFEPEVKVLHSTAKAEVQPVVLKPVAYEIEPEPARLRAEKSKSENEVHSGLNQEVKSEEYSRFKLSPIKSLKEGLVLNDRYLFQKELFNNDKSRLDETIDALDRLDNIHEAVDYLKANFRWTKNEASEKFVQLVKRRFSEPKG